MSIEEKAKELWDNHSIVLIGEADFEHEAAEHMGKEVIMKEDFLECAQKIFEYGKQEREEVEEAFCELFRLCNRKLNTNPSIFSGNDKKIIEKAKSIMPTLSDGDTTGMITKSPIENLSK